MLSLKLNGLNGQIGKPNIILLLASGEPVDLITVATDWLDTWQNAQKGAFQPLR